MPPQPWRVKDVLPAFGLAAFYGASTAGKSFAALEMAAAIAEGMPFFGHATKPAPVLIVGLEGESGYRGRVLAWQRHHGRAMPDNVAFLLQPFRLTDPQDVADLAAICPPGCVVFIDTLNRAAPGTRNEVQRHEVAGVVAARTVEALEKSKAAIERRAELLYSDGVAQAEREFSPRASHAALESEIRTYIRELANKADGPSKIRAAMLESKDVAAVIFHSPGFLVGINPETHSKLRFEATEKWLPDAYKRMTGSIALSELAPKFAKAANSVRNSFYNPTLAAKASTRVQF